MLTALDVLTHATTHDDRHDRHDGFGEDLGSAALEFTYPAAPRSFIGHCRSRSLGLPAASFSSPVRRAVAPGIETVLEEDEDRLSSRHSSPMLSSAAFAPSSASTSDSDPTSVCASLSASLSSFDDFLDQLRRDFHIPSSCVASSASSSLSSSPQLGHASFSLGAGGSVDSLVDPKVVRPALIPRKSSIFKLAGELAGPGPAPTWALPALPGAVAGAFEGELEWDGDGDGSEGYWDALEEFAEM